MKTMIRFFLTMFAIITISTQSIAQWVQTNGPCGGTVRALAVSGTSLFAGTGGGLYRSLNNGASWTSKSANLTNLYVQAIAVGGENLFIGTGGGVFLSTDNGTSWTAVNTGLTNLSVNALAVNDTSVLAGTDGGIFRTTDNGSSWTLQTASLVDEDNEPYGFHSCAVLSDGTIFAGSYDGFFRSTDNGSTWTAAGTGMTNKAVGTLAVIGSNLFVGTNGGVFLSTDNGTSWTAVNTGLTSQYVHALAVSGTDLFAGTDAGGVFLSTNSGTNWTSVNSGLTYSTVNALAVSGTDLFAGTNNGGGIFHSTDKGTNWTASNTGLTNTNVRSLMLSPDGGNLFAGTDGSGAFVTTNNGTTWTASNNGLPEKIVYAFAASNTMVFAGTWAGGVYRSTDNGASWTAVKTSVPSRSVQALVLKGATLFAGLGGYIYRSTDNGDNWTSASTGLTDPDVSAFAVSGNNLFVGTSSGVFRSTDDGTNWTASSTGLTNTDVQTLACIPSGIGDTLLFAGTGGGAFLSTNNGAGWTAASTGLNNKEVRSFAASSGGATIFASTYGGGVFVSTNKGTSWSNVNTGLALSNLHTYTLAMSGTDLFTGTFAGGVWRRPLVEMITPSAPALASPSNNTTDVATSTTLSWNKSATASTYRLQISIDSTFATTIVDQLGLVDTSYAVSTLEDNTRYYWRVNATNQAGAGAYSSFWRFNTINLAPAIPQNLVATDSSSRTITIKWRKNSERDFLRYYIYRNSSPNPTTKVDSTTGGKTDTSKTFAGLTNGTRYYVRITAVDSTGLESGYSNEVNVVPADRIAPSAPQNLVTTDSSSRTMTIKWRKNTEADFLRYRIYRGTAPDPTIKVDSTSGGAGDTTKTFTGLTNGTLYYFRVTAVDSSNNESGYSNEVSNTPADRVPPAAPVNLVVTDSSGATIGIKWRKNTEADFLRYRIYRGTSPSPTTKVDSTTGGATDTSKTFTGLTNGTRYYLTVTAVDSAGNESAYSNEVNGTPNVPVAVDDILSQIPKEYSLFQNYPNPFNPSTTIRYGLPSRSSVRLVVINVLGQTVAELVNSEQEAGYQSMIWNAEVSSGVYIYRVTANSLGDPTKHFVDTKKMLLLR